MHRRTFIGTATTVAAVAVTGCIGSGSSDGEFDIDMSSNAFLPEEYIANAGDTVVWKNTNSRAHSVTAYGSGIPDGATYFATGEFESEKAARKSWKNQSGHTGGRIFGGETYEHTFEQPGEYDYFCIPHEAAGMVGTVIVE